MSGTGLSANPKEYRTRLADQADDQIDRWVAELMRDVVKRRGIVKVVTDFRAAARLSEPEFERVFAFGGGAPKTLGRDRDGREDVGHRRERGHVGQGGIPDLVVRV